MAYPGRRTFVGITAVMMLMAAGCKSRPRATAAATQPSPPVELLKRPAIDLTRGGAGFPLETKSVPSAPAAVAAALKAGYALRLESPDKVRIDIAPGPADGAFARMVIDISGSAVRQDYVPKQQPKQIEPVAFLRAGLLNYVAEPLRYRHFTAGMRLDANEAKLGVLPAADGTFGLSLVDCATAHASLSLSMDGLKQSLAKGVQSKQSLAFMVENVDLDLTSDNPRSLEADVLVRARLLLLPAHFRITGRADITDAFNVHFTKLNAAGLNATGKIVAGVVQSRLDKLNNKAAPLLKLPGDRIRLTDVAINVGEALTIDADLIGGGL
ncbi:MAG TPA: hypothetical protein VF595_11205 [Tepidisphaeraceae bacterium]|jgi:hypothetical protein